MVKPSGRPVAVAGGEEIIVRRKRIVFRVEQVLDVAADEHAGERVDGSHDHVVATADSEDEAAAAQAVIRVGGDDDVCRG